PGGGRDVRTFADIPQPDAAIERRTNLGLLELCIDDREIRLLHLQLARGRVVLFLSNELLRRKPGQTSLPQQGEIAPMQGSLAQRVQLRVVQLHEQFALADAGTFSECDRNDASCHFASKLDV